MAPCIGESGIAANWTLRTTQSSPSGNPILYAGYHYDEETGLYKVRHRTYHPTLGRWMQQDPKNRMYGPKVTGGYHDGMNLYEYVRSGPASYVDPDGRVIVTLAGWWESPFAMEPVGKATRDQTAWVIAQVIGKDTKVKHVLRGWLWITGQYDAALVAEYTKFVERKVANPCSVEQFIVIGHSSGASAIYNTAKAQTFRAIEKLKKDPKDQRRFAPAFLGFIDMVLYIGKGAPSLAGHPLAKDSLNYYQEEDGNVLLRGKAIGGVKSTDMSAAPGINHFSILRNQTVIGGISSAAVARYLRAAMNDAAILIKAGLKPKFAPL